MQVLTRTVFTAVLMHAKKKKKKRVSLFTSVKYINFAIANVKNEEIIDI